MLVLTRKGNQSIMIGDEIEISVLAIMGEKVRIGIEAPRSIPVFRKEVYLDIQRDREAEAAGDGATPADGAGSTRALDDALKASSGRLSRASAGDYRQRLEHHRRSR